MESYSVAAVLSATDRNFTSTMRGAAGLLDDVESKSGKASSALSRIGGTAVAFKAVDAAIQAVSGSLEGAISRFDTMNRFPRVMEQLGFSSEKSEASIQKLSDGIDGLPTSLDTITASTQKLTLLTGDLDKSTDAAIALNDAFLASGSTYADVERGLIQYTQMLSKGTVDVISWRTLQETMGPALKEVAGAFGFAGQAATTDFYKALQGGEITFDQLNDKLIELDGGVGGFAERAKTNSAGIGTSFKNLQTAMIKGVTSIIDATDQMLVDNGFGTLAENIDSAKGIINSASAAIASGISTAGSVISTLAPVLKVGAAAWATYKGSMLLYDATGNAVSKITDVKTAIDKSSQSMRLAADAANLKATAEKISENATTLNNKAERYSTVLESLSIRSKQAAKKASEARAAASKLETAAETAKSAAVKAGLTNEKLNTAATVASQKATEARAKADTLSTTAKKLKTKVESTENKTTIANAAAQKASTASTTANTAATAASSTAVTVKSVAVGVLTGQITAAEGAQLLWNAAMAANPIGAIVAVAVAATAAFAGLTYVLNNTFNQSSKDFKDFIAETESVVKKSEDLTKSMDDSAKAYKNTADDIDASAVANRDLADEIINLSGLENKSADDKAKLQSYVEALNGTMEGLNLQYLEENDALNISTEMLDKKVSAYEAMAEAQAAQERYTEIVKEQIKNEESLADIEKQRNELEKEYGDLTNASLPVIAEYNSKTKDLAEEESNRNAKQLELADSLKYVEGVMVESQKVQNAAATEGAQIQITSLEQLEGAAASTAESLKTTWQGYYDQATNLFETLSDESELSVAEMTENLLENQRVIGEWSSNIQALVDRGLNQGLIEQLRAAGPESAGAVAEMVAASDAELQALSEAFSRGGTTATEAMKTTLDTSTIPDDVMSLITKSTDPLQTLISEAFTGLGTDATAGYALGMSEGTDGIAAAATASLTAGINAAAVTQDSNSPSVVYKGLGLDAVSGYVQGILSGQPAISLALQTAMQSGISASSNTVVTGVQQIAELMARGFLQLPAIVSAGMSGVISTIQSGMAGGQQVVSAGSAGMAQSVRTGMQEIGSAGATGTSQFVSGITSGMSKAKAILSTDTLVMGLTVRTWVNALQTSGKIGMAAYDDAVSRGMNVAKNSVSSNSQIMVSTLDGLGSRFYSSGAYASQGLANGINDRAPVALSAARKLGDSVAATLERSLDIGSPSKRTHEIGGFTSMGLGLGIIDEIGFVENASEKLAEAAVPGDITGRLNLYSNSSAFAPMFPSNRGPGETITVEVPVILDGREIARVTAPYTRDELNKLDSRLARKVGNL